MNQGKDTRVLLEMPLCLPRTEDRAKTFDLSKVAPLLSPEVPGTIVSVFLMMHGPEKLETYGSHILLLQER